MRPELKSALESIEDERIPCELRVPTESYPESRQDRFKAFAQRHVLRDGLVDLSEVKDREEFTEQELAALEALGDKDYSAILGCGDEGFVEGELGVPAPPALRQLWLGFTPSGGWLRKVEFNSRKLKRTLTCSLWKAVFVAYWYDQSGKEVRELLASLPPVSLLDFFYRYDRLDPRECSAFAEPMTEEGRALPAKLVSKPSPEVVDWAEGEVERLLGSAADRAGCDTSLVLMVLASSLKKQEKLSDEVGALLNISSGSWLGRKYAALIKRLSDASLCSVLERELACYERSAHDPLVPLTDLCELTELLRALKSPSTEVLRRVFTPLIAFQQRHPRLAGVAVRDAELNQLLLSATEGQESPPEWQEFLSAVNQGNEDSLPPLRRPQSLVDVNTLASLDDAAVRQLRAVGLKVFGVDDERLILRRSTENRIAWLRYCAVDDDENRLVDVWLAKWQTARLFGFLFLPDGDKVVPHVSFSHSWFVARDGAVNRRLRSLRLNSRKESEPAELDDWAGYLESIQA